MWHGVSRKQDCNYASYLVPGLILQQQFELEHWPANNNNSILQQKRKVSNILTYQQLNDFCHRHCSFSFSGWCTFFCAKRSRLLWCCQCRVDDVQRSQNLVRIFATAATGTNGFPKTAEKASRFCTPKVHSLSSWCLSFFVVLQENTQKRYRERRAKLDNLREENGQLKQEMACLKQQSDALEAAALRYKQRKEQLEMKKARYAELLSGDNQNQNKN